jgi:hypothetical protein
MDLLGGAGAFDIDFDCYPALTHIVQRDRVCKHCGVGGSSSLFRQAVQTTLSLQLRSWRSFVAVALYPRNNAASKFENHISRVHDVAIVRHNDESAAPVPACVTQQNHYVACVFVVQISGWLVGENKNWVVRQGSSNRDALLFTTTQL